jgi:predicted RNA-binding protein with PIN domain
MRAKRPRSPIPPPEGVCLVDGHNVILGVPPLALLQHADRGEEARARLAEACLRFALRRRLHVVLVFDGSPDVRAPAGRAKAPLEIVYATGAGKADAVLVARATRFSAEKRSVLLVSQDRSLQAALPRGTRTLGVTAFWALLESRPDAPAEEKPEFSLPDVEQFFLDAEPRLRAELKRPPKKRGGA